ncbi:DUF6011 domain-containing protein [Bacillus cereus group sp. MYBK12-2]
MIRCAVCSRPLKDPKSQEKGVGERCAKLLTPEVLQEISWF